MPRQGWGKPALSRKYHWFEADGRCLCGSWGFYTGPLEEGRDDHPENCVTCRKRKARQEAKKPC